MRNASRSVHRAPLPNVSPFPNHLITFPSTPTVNAQCKPFRAPCPIEQCKPISNPSQYFSSTPTVNAQYKPFHAPCPIAQCKPISNPSHYFSCTPTVNAQCKPFCAPCQNCPIQALLLAISLLLLHNNGQCAMQAVLCPVSTSTLIHFHFPLDAFLTPWCISNPMTASDTRSLEVFGTHCRKYPSRCNPTVHASRGGANSRITPGPHTQQFGGARHYVTTKKVFIW